MDRLMDRLTNSRRPKEDNTQDARVGILIQTILEAQNAIAARKSPSPAERESQSNNDRRYRSVVEPQVSNANNMQAQSTTPPQTFNDVFHLYLGKLDSLVSTQVPPPLKFPFATYNTEST